MAKRKSDMTRVEQAAALGVSRSTLQRWLKMPDFPADLSIFDQKRWVALNKAPTIPNGDSAAPADLREQKLRADIEATLNRTDRAQRKLLQAYESEVVSKVSAALAIVADELDSACQGCPHLSRVKHAIRQAMEAL